MSLQTYKEKGFEMLSWGYSTNSGDGTIEWCSTGMSLHLQLGDRFFRSSVRNAFGQDEDRAGQVV